MQREQSTKMSLCTFRLPVISFIIVLSFIHAPAVGFSLRRNTRLDPNRDLVQEESVILEVRSDLKQHNDVQVNRNETSYVTETEKKQMVTDSKIEAVTNENYSENDPYIGTTDVIDTESLSLKEAVDEQEVTDSTLPVTISLDSQTFTTNRGLETDTESFLTTSNLQYGTEIETTTSTELRLFNMSNSLKSDEPKNNINKIKQKFTEPEKNYVTDKKLKNLDWKKYTTIDRKKIAGDKINKVVKEEDIMNAETKQQRVTLKDTLTSYIPSLEQLKNDLLLSTLKVQTSEGQSDPTTKIFVSNQITTATSSNTTPSTSFAQNISQGKGKEGAVETKRAGFLNFSEKTTTEEIKTERGEYDFKADNIGQLRSMFETESPEIDIMNIKSGSRFETQIVLNEDAIKEELLKEELLNDNEENAQRQREGYDNKVDLIEIRKMNPDNSTQTYPSSVDNLSVKPISAEKSKNSTLYVVNPNYKPMKKIEVLPPKSFVRDPDDNSWRNESLSSLGIVFKPKNSSKPLTQVLKNKTEIEWNNVSERDSKNDLPDLRERLQKMAEKRKSRRKKIDSLGNIVYFDYDENSSSAERSNTPIENVSSYVVTPSTDLKNPSNITRVPVEEPQAGNNNTTSTLPSTTESIRKKLFTTNITKKPKNFFNVPEYYESTDDEDTDYLNMAKIDLKKFTTSLRPSTPFHPSTIVAKQPDWSKVNTKISNNFFPERKATVQYFPPLTTQKVNVNDYDNGFKSRVESFTTEKQLHKNVLPVYSDMPTTTVRTIDRSMLSAFQHASKPDLILTQPPMTTESGLTVLNNEGNYDTGTYVMKNFKDFVNVAARDFEFDKNTDYMPYTEAPIEGITKTDYISYDRDKTGTNIDDTYDYETQFRRDILQRFVNNFNQNSERYKSDFPVLFNSSVIHRGTEYGRDVASSRSFMRGSYNNVFKGKMSPRKKSCDPNCEKITVELSPAYELHYYVPEQEEKEEAVPQPVTLPYQYRL